MVGAECVRIPPFIFLIEYIAICVARAIYLILYMITDTAVKSYVLNYEMILSNCR